MSMTIPIWMITAGKWILWALGGATAVSLFIAVVIGVWFLVTWERPKL